MYSILKEAFGIECCDSAHTVLSTDSAVMHTCTTCGGSGIQRVSGQRFRTCLTCLGTGQLTSALQPAPILMNAKPDIEMSRLRAVTQPRR